MTAVTTWFDPPIRVDVSQISILVSVSDDHRDQLATVVANLSQAGLEVEGVQGAVGVITGTAPLSAMAALVAVPGVAGVERQRPNRIGPPRTPMR